MAIRVRGDRLEQELLGQVSTKRLHEYVSTVARDERMSGSVGERRAMDYIAATLRSWNVEVEEYEHDGWVSRPLRATLDVQAPEPGPIECITHSFAASGRWSGELVYAGMGDDAAYAQVDAAGKAVLLEGLAAPGKVVAAQRHGAAAAVFITDRNLHQMIVTPVWGTPTPETIDKVPHILAVSLRLQDGERLRALTERGSVRVAIDAEVEIAWARLPVVVGTVRGALDPEHFVMLGGHIDSWFYGAIDNGAANATALEVMRLFAAERSRMRRGFRVVFWSGHSHGRYAGSAWYADTFWEELYDRCVAYVNVDSTGATGATLYEEILAMPETGALALDVIADVTRQQAELTRVGRAGDQSFWGIGIPSVYMSLSRVSIDSAPELSRAMGALTGRRKSGQAWFWHTEHDTLDKVDLDVLHLDTQVYLATVLRLANSPILPFDYAATVDELLVALRAYHERAGHFVDLDAVIARAESLRGEVQALTERVATIEPDGPRAAAANQALVDLGRILVPLNYTEAGPFEHDLALHVPALPALHGMQRLARLDPQSDEHRFLRTQLMRRRNLVTMTLRRAQERTAQALAALS
jgi:Iap family predicted aminopeptidase